MFGSQKNNEVIECPVCHHRQKESIAAISSNCKKCGKRFNLENGKLIEEKVQEYKPKVKFAENFETKEEERIDLWEHVESVGTPEVMSAGAKDSIEVYQPVSTYQAKEKSAQLNHWRNPLKKRQVECFRCEFTHESPAGAESANCPKCGLYISLQNHVIKTLKNESIQTRGNVKITRSGSMKRSSLRCHDLIIQGEFEGGVDSTGTIEVFETTNFKGNLRCQKLIIHKNVKVTASSDVNLHDLSCMGSLEAADFKLRSTGTMTIGKLGRVSFDEMHLHACSVSEGGQCSGAVISIQ